MWHALENPAGREGPTVPNRAFLSYAREDEEHARRIYDGLMSRGVDVWFDKMHIAPGRWRPQILRAITQSRFFVACLSRSALQRLESAPGFQDTELTTAFQIALDQSEDRFTIIPVRLEETDRGDHRVSTFQQYDLFTNTESVLDKLAVSMGGHRLNAAPAENEQSPGRDDELAQAMYGKAMFFYETRQFAKALSLIQSIEEFSGSTVATVSDRASTLHALHRYDEALEAVERALAMRDDEPRIWHNKAIILSSMGRLAEAYKSLQKVMELDPSDTSILQDLGILLFKLERSDEALEVLSRLLRAEPNHARAHAAQGIIFQQLKRDEEALLASQMAVMLDPSITVAHETVGMTLVRSHRCSDALPHLEKAIALGSRAASVHSAKGVALLDAGRLVEAEAAFDEALSINPDHAQASRCKLLVNRMLRERRN
jgi:Flp pilus assembly protein TadD